MRITAMLPSSPPDRPSKKQASNVASAITEKMRPITSTPAIFRRVRLAKIRLSMARRMRQRHEHLPLTKVTVGRERYSPSRWSLCL